MMKPPLDKREYEEAERAQIMREFDLLKLKRAELAEATAEREERPQRIQQPRGPGNRHERRSARHRPRQSSGGTCSGGEG